MEFEQNRKNLEKSIADRLIGKQVVFKGHYNIKRSMMETPLIKDVVERWNYKKVSENIYVEVYGTVTSVGNHYDLGLKIRLREKDGALLNNDSVLLFGMDLRKKLLKDGYGRFYVWSDVNLYWVNEDINIDDKIKERIEHLMYSVR